MTDITEQPTNPTLDTQKDGVPWWNRPVIGEDSIVDDLLGKFRKPEISENALFLHNREMMDVRVFAKTAEAIDNEKFCNEEFLQFVRMKCAIAKGIGEYAGLENSIQLLQVAIEAKDSFISVDQTELRYRGSKQQNFYEYIEEQLKDHTDKAAFRQNVQTQLQQTLPQIKTDEGKSALQSYAEHLDSLSKNELGLKLLCLFKTYQLADYSILRIISDMIQGLNKHDLLDFKSLLALVMVNFSVFEKLRLIIGVSERQHKPETYARMIQYIALSYRHGLSYLKFDELVKVMRQWVRPYNAIVGIRNEHSPKEFRIPKEFTEPIPGVEIYFKYKGKLTDQKTGFTYLNFDEE